MKKLKNVVFAMVTFLVSAFFISSCSDPVSVVPSEFILRAYNYSDSHYFFDTIYKASFLDYFNNTTGVLRPETEANRVLSEDWNTFEVWVQTDITTIDKRYAAAITMLHSQPGSGYDSSYKTLPQTEGKIFNGYFRKLHQSEYVSYPYAGFISLKINVFENYAVAVTYKTVNDSLYGTPSSAVNGNDTLILKMIKCPNINPATMPTAWELKMKNVYRLPYNNIIPYYLTLDVIYLKDGTYQNKLPGFQKSLSTMLDIDRYTGVTGEPPPDGKFDFGILLDEQTGDVIFPTLRPFWDNFVREGVDSSYFYKEIYTEIKLNAANPSIAPNADKYSIKGSAVLESY